MVERYFRLDYVRAFIFLIGIVFVGCTLINSNPPEVDKGSSKCKIITLLGNPDKTQDFILPDEPFFGPQEGLVNLVPAGTVIEEWVYEIGEEDLYIWFTGDMGESREAWLVLATARYPKDAVY